MAGFNPDAYAKGFDPDAYAGKPKRPFNTALDSFGRGMTMAPASAALDALLGQGGKEGEGYFEGFGGRVKQAKAYYDEKNQRARAENPNAYTGGQIATGLMGAVATSPLAGVMGPMSTLSRGAGSIMGEALPASINAVTHAGAGVMDAALANMGIAAATNADRSQEEVGAAMQNAAQSPMNLIGMANALPDVVAAAPAAAQEWRDVGNRMRTRREAPQDAEAQRIFEERHGSPERAGEAMRQFDRADKPGTTSRERADIYDFERKTAGARKGDLIEKSELLGGKGDPEAGLAQMRAYRNRRYGWEPEGNATTRNVAEDTAAMQQLDDVISQFEQSYRETYRPTGMNVEYQGGVQGEFGPTSTSRTVEGQRLVPGVPDEVVGTAETGRSASAVTPRAPGIENMQMVPTGNLVLDPKTGNLVPEMVPSRMTRVQEPGYQQPMAGARPVSRLERDPSAMPRVGEPEVSQLANAEGRTERGYGTTTVPTHPMEPNYSSTLTPEQNATYPQDVRPNQGSAAEVRLKHKPFTVEPTRETSTQSSLFPMARDAAGEWATHTFPDAPPGTGGTAGGPVATSTNVAVRGQPVQLWSKLKSRWDAITKQRAAKGYQAGTPAEVIKNDPHLRDMDELSNILRAEEDAIAKRTLSPAEYKQFVAAKARQHDAETFFPIAKRGGHAEVAGASAETAGTLHPSRAGTIAWLERLFAAPARSRIGIPFSDYANRLGREQATMTPRPSMFGKNRNLSAEAIAAEIVRRTMNDEEN